MKLLLTSGGITNDSISKALFELVGKGPEETKLVFIPTAANVQMEEKDWFINDLLNIRRQGFKEVMIADVSAVPENIWRPQLEAADILFFEGGDTYHLMKWINQSGLVSLLPELLKTKVYVGSSAGSMVTNPDLNVQLSKIVYEEDAEDESIKGLNYVDLYILPHFNSPFFPKRKKEIINEMIKTLPRKVYALDDNSALKVVDGKVEVITEGEYAEFN